MYFYNIKTNYKTKFKMQVSTQGNEYSQFLN
jgi:hypothetical protein